MGAAPEPEAAGGLRIGTFAGAPVIVDWTVALMAGYFVLTDLSAGGLAALPRALAYVAALLISILAHECAHAGVAAALNLPSKRIVLTLFGGHVEFLRPPEKRWHDIAVSAAGPLANLALWRACLLAAALLAPASGGGDDAGGSGGAIFFVAELGFINLLLGAFNLLPGFPLDGGRILQAALGYILSPGRARLVAAWCGLAIAAATGLFGAANGLVWTTGVALLLGLAALGEAARAGREIRTARERAIS
jgi:Zn-dependent protease